LTLNENDYIIGLKMIKYNHNKSKNSKTKAAESRTPGHS